MLVTAFPQKNGYFYSLKFWSCKVPTKAAILFQYFKSFFFQAALHWRGRHSNLHEKIWHLFYTRRPSWYYLGSKLQFQEYKTNHRATMAQDFQIIMVFKWKNCYRSLWRVVTMIYIKLWPSLNSLITSRFLRHNSKLFLFHQRLYSSVELGWTLFSTVQLVFFTPL